MVEEIIEEIIKNGEDLTFALLTFLMVIIVFLAYRIESKREHDDRTREHGERVRQNDRIYDEQRRSNDLREKEISLHAAQFAMLSGKVEKIADTVGEIQPTIETTARETRDFVHKEHGSTLDSILKTFQEGQVQVQKGQKETLEGQARIEKALADFKSMVSANTGLLTSQRDQIDKILFYVQLFQHSELYDPSKLLNKSSEVAT